MSDDSRVSGVSLGPSGIIRKTFSPDGKLERAFCKSCGDPGGWVTSENVDRIEYVCSVCDTFTVPPPLSIRLEQPI